MLVPLACGAGAPSWVDFAESFQFLGSLGLSSWMLGGVLLGTFVVGFVIVGGAFALSTAIETWRERVPVPQVPNPVLEGATVDLAKAVEVLRRSADRQRAAPLLANAEAKIARASGRLSRKEQRQLDRAWKIVRWSGA